MGTGGSGSGGAAPGTGGSGCLAEILTNGTFDQGPVAWTVESRTGSPIIYRRNDPGLVAMAVVPPSVEYLAWLGQNLTAGEDVLSQPIAPPPQANVLILQGFVRLARAPTSACATCPPSLVAEIQTGAARAEIRTWTAAEVTDTWTAFSTAIDRQTIGNGAVLRFRLTNANGSHFHAYFDSLSLKATSCPSP